MNHINSNSVSHKGLFLRTGLWAAQVLLAGVYLSTGLAALFLPMTEVSAIAPWAAHMPAAVLTFIGAVDVAAGAGVLLPSWTRIAPGLTVLAALCSAVLQVLVIFSFALLGTLGTEFPVNVAIFALSLFVAWGRSGAAPVASRWQDRRMPEIDVFVSGGDDRPDGSPSARRRRMRRRPMSRGNRHLQVRRGLRAAPFYRAEKEESRR